MPANGVSALTVVAALLLQLGSIPSAASRTPLLYEGPESRSSSIHEIQVGTKEEGWKHSRELLVSKTDAKLWNAASQGQTHLVNEALREGANPNFQMGMYGDTPLTIAAYNGHMEVVLALLKHPETDINGTDAMGSTAILEAAEGGHFGIVEYLIEGGADVDKARVDGVTPMYIAARKGHSAIVAELLEEGADPTAADDTGATPLHVASATISQHSVLVAQYLLDSMADVNAVSVDGTTPLMWAAEFGNFGTARVLLERSADATVVNENGETALDLICVCTESAGFAGYIQCPEGGCEMPDTRQKLREALLKATKEFQ